MVMVFCQKSRNVTVYSALSMLERSAFLLSRHDNAKVLFSILFFDFSQLITHLCIKHRIHCPNSHCGLLCLFSHQVFCRLVINPENKTCL